MRVHFTDLAIKNFRAGSYWDDATPGFGIRVGKRAKTWSVMRGVNRERLTIGRYPDVKLSEARIEAKRLLSATPEPKTPSVGFKTARSEYLDQHYRDCAPRTLYEATRHLTGHFADLDALDLTEVDDRHIEKCLKGVKAPSEKLHAYRFARTFFRWCTRPPRRYIKHSPMEGYEPPGKDKRGTRILSDAELVKVYGAAPGVVKLLILWGTRQTETASLHRDWKDRDVMTIPGSHTKNGRDHSIPILPMADEILRGSNSAYYFPSRWGDSHLSNGAWSKIKREIQRASATKEWKLRDLRRTFRSNMARLKVPRELAEILINHAPPVLDEIYDRYDRLEEKRDALSRYEKWLQTLINP